MERRASFFDRFQNYPRVFWITLISTGLIILISLLDWINTTTNYSYYRNIPIRLNFSMIFGRFDDSGLYYLLESMNLYRAINFITTATFVLLVISVLMLIFSMTRHSNKKLMLKLSVIGLSIAGFASVLFMLYTVIATGEVISSGLTLFPLLVLVVVLIALPNLAEATDVENKKLRKFLHQKAFFFMITPIMIYVFIFNYLPLTGWQMAFQNFRPGHETHAWVGLRWFEFLFSDAAFSRIMINTLAMSVINLVLGFSTSIFLALMINEIRQKFFKRFVQTISYLPHFLSWVIAASLIGAFLTSDGILNTILVGLGIYDEPRLFRAEPDSFWWIIGWGNVWKSVGWNTIIYLAAITSIDPALYESAELDGAGRFAKMWHITLPGIKSTILVLLIMSIGWILNAGFEPQFLLSNDLTIDRAETIDLYVIRYGIARMNFSLGTAMGMFKTVVSIILITGANQLSKRIAKESLV